MKRPRHPRSARPDTSARGPQTPAKAGRPARRDGPRHRAKTEEVFHGVRACEALFARRPQDIVRVYVDEPRRRHFATLLAWCAAERRGFQVVAAENLARLTGSIHHEGVAILAKQIPRASLADLLATHDRGGLTGPLVYLDGVQNPHNLGSILRTAAHFGAAAIVGRLGDLPPVSPAAARVAEGAAEHVPVCELADPAADLARLKRAGWRVAVTSSHRGESLFETQAGPRVIVVFGSEGEGVSRAVEAEADLRLRIPGTGGVESLNVSVAAGVVLGEIWRRSHGPGTPSGRR